MITPEAIENPRDWRLALLLDEGAIRAVVSSMHDDPGLMHFSVPLDPTAEPLKALEDAIYSTPVLLQDFGRIDVLVHTRAFCPVPSELPDEGCEATASMMQLVPEGTGVSVVTDRPGMSMVKMVWAIDTATYSFIGRTFRNPAIECHISPLLRYFSRKNLLGNSAKVYAHLSMASQRRVDLLVFGSDRSLQIATSHDCATDTDIIYYILAAARRGGLDFESDEILLSGDAGLRDSVMPVLRGYVNYVMPVIFPSVVLRADREALKAPFPLIILPLCE